MLTNKQIEESEQVTEDYGTGRDGDEANDSAVPANSEEAYRQEWVNRLESPAVPAGKVEKDTVESAALPFVVELHIADLRRCVETFRNSEWSATFARTATEMETAADELQRALDLHRARPAAPSSPALAALATRWETRAKELQASGAHNQDAEEIAAADAIWACAGQLQQAIPAAPAFDMERSEGQLVLTMDKRSAILISKALNVFYGELYSGDQAGRLLRADADYIKQHIDAGIESLDVPLPAPPTGEESEDGK